MDDSEINLTPTSAGARDSNSTSTTKSGASFSNDNGPTFGVSGSYHKSTTDAKNNNNTPTFKTMQTYGVDHDDQGSQSGSEGYRSTDDDESASAQTAEELRKKMEEDNAYREALAKEETKAIRRLKLILILLLLCVAATIATLVYLFTSEVEQSEFEDEFLEQGSKLVTGFYADSFQKMQALESLSSGLTFQFLNHTWPFVTIPRSHEYFQPFLSLANAASIKLLPIVHARQRLKWEEHVAKTQGWVVEDLAKQQQQQQQQIAVEGVGHPSGSGDQEQLEEGNGNNNSGRSLQYFGDAEDIENSRVSPFIKNYVGIDTSPRIWTPSWQYAPVIPNKWFINFNQLADAEFKRDFKEIYKNKQAVIAKAETYLPGLDFQSTRDLTFTEQLLDAGGYGQYEPGEPIGYIHYPVFEDPEESDTIVAIITATVYWKTYFQDILPDNVKGIVCVVENEEQTFTYKIDGTRAIFLGMDDMHDPIYDELEISADYKAFETVDAETTGRPYTGVPVDETRLAYRIRVYPSKEMQEQYTTNEPILYAAVVAAVMLFAVLVFVVYDCYVERRQKKVSNVAVQSNAIVSSLFPTSVKEKLFKIEESQNKSKRRSQDNAFKNPALQQSPAKRALKSLGGSVSVATGGSDEKKKGKASKAFNNLDDIDELDPLASSNESDPIADFFPSATVLFMDIAGFTAWSSSREPSQVFLLLETIYRSFDKVANRRRVFKVETIGDCYMAVCGLPEPCANHAPVMASFARDCLDKMDQLVHKLVPKLGPETTDLQVRVGLHSGPVTAGVLRGDRARFQLFGDTVNTASRMESTGKPGHIQCSQECAELISAGGRQKWLRERPDAIHAKGKGELQTFWIVPKSARTASTTSSNPFLSSSTASETPADPIAYMSDESNRFVLDIDDTEAPDPSELEREIREQQLQGLIDFNYDILLNILKDIIAKHSASQGGGSTRDLEAEPEKVRVPLESGKKSCLDEVAAIIELPNFDQTAYEKERSMGVEVSMEVKLQLRMYCAEIARMYCENPFHGWEHASHVVQSSSKLLSRIVAVKEIGTGAQAHDATFGITSDPLTQFAVIFSAMIHDVDHRGVPNSILAKEQPEMAKLYQNHAIAEQNSVDIAWNLLMEPTYSDLRGAIYHGQTEMKRFRQLVVNCLMGTDIFDKKLKAIREQRWQKAFHTQSERKKFNEDEFYDEEEEQEAINRKATIVIEHIIQASDVSHCMQHWHVYSKWNEKLFNEMYKAYKDGRSTTDPSGGWYKGELWFFDNYVIPLAQKLEECGVFGVSSDEFLIYARANRAEWEKKGESIVEANMKRIRTWMEEEKGREDLMQLPTQLPFEQEEEKADMERIKSYLKQGQQEQTPPEQPKNEVGTNLRSAMKSESSFNGNGSAHLSSVEVWTGISASPQKKRSIVESDTCTIESQLSC